MGVLKLQSSNEFAAKINGSQVVVVDFFATWCGPCKVISPKFHAFSETYKSLIFVQVDVDEVPDVAQKCGIRAMPTFQIYKNGQMVEEIVGADPNKLERAIQKYA